MGRDDNRSHRERCMLMRQHKHTPFSSLRRACRTAPAIRDCHRPVAALTLELAHVHFIWRCTVSKHEASTQTVFDPIGQRYEGLARPSGLRYGIIEVTTRCQLACPGCYMVRRGALNHGSLSFDQAVGVLDRCCEYTGRELETMDILGGEPLLWPPLKEYIVELLNRGIKPWLFTNMLTITPSLARWLFERKVHITGKLNVDPSDPAQLSVQAAMIGRNERVARRMAAAISVWLGVGYRNPLFRLQNLVRQANIGFVPDYYRWCLEQGIGTDLELMGSGETVGAEYYAVAPTPKQVARMIEAIHAVRREYGLPEAEVLMPHVFGSCPFYDKGLYFAADCSIRACSNSTVTLAHLSDQDPIRKAYESPLICRRLSLCREVVGEPCRSCDRWERCRGGCRATVEGMGDPYGGYTLCPLPYLGNGKPKVG